MTRETVVLIFFSIFSWIYYLKEKKNTKKRKENSRTMFYFKSLDLRVLMIAILVTIVTIYFILGDIS